MSLFFPVIALALALILQVDPATVGRPAADEFAAARFPELIARFNEKMKAAAPEPVLRQIHARLLPKLGAYDASSSSGTAWADTWRPTSPPRIRRSAASS